MKSINLTKTLEKDSLRWIGENYDSLFPNKTVIAGQTIHEISKALNLPCYRFGRFSITNVFIAHDSLKIFYVFVNPDYRNYRLIFKNVLGSIRDGFHVDHILSRNLAKYFGYNYTLLCMIPSNVNSSHGHYEKIKTNSTIVSPKVCYSDNRIFHKILSRPAKARQKEEELKTGYNPSASPPFGLTLKQKGIWNTAFGFDIVNIASLVERTFKI